MAADVSSTLLSFRSTTLPLCCSPGSSIATASDLLPEAPPPNGAGLPKFAAGYSCGTGAYAPGGGGSAESCNMLSATGGLCGAGQPQANISQSRCHVIAAMCCGRVRVRRPCRRVAHPRRGRRRERLQPRRIPRQPIQIRQCPLGPPAVRPILSRRRSRHSAGYRQPLHRPDRRLRVNQQLDLRCIADCEAHRTARLETHQGHASSTALSDSSTSLGSQVLSAKSRRKPSHQELTRVFTTFLSDEADTSAYRAAARPPRVFRLGR